MKCTEFVKCGQEKSCLNFGRLELGLELGIRLELILAHTLAARRKWRVPFILEHNRVKIIVAADRITQKT